MSRTGLINLSRASTSLLHSRKPISQSHISPRTVPSYYTPSSPEYIETVLALRGIERTNVVPTAHWKIRLNSPLVGRIEPLADTGATISCVSWQMAQRFRKLWRRVPRPFQVRTSNAWATIKYFIPLTVTKDPIQIGTMATTTKAREYYIKFYILDGLLYEWLLSRYALHKMRIGLVDLESYKGIYLHRRSDDTHVLHDSDFLFEKLDPFLNEEVYNGKRPKRQQSTPLVQTLLDVECSDDFDGRQNRTIDGMYNTVLAVDATSYCAPQLKHLNLDMKPIASNTARKQFERTIHSYIEQVSAKNSFDLGRMANDEFHMRIELHANAKPFKGRLLPYSHEHVEEMQKQVSQLLQHKLICKSHSEWAAPLLFVKKKGGTWRMCVDFRKLNAMTKRDNWPLLNVDDTLKDLGMYKIFSKLDIRSAFWHVPIREEDKHKTAFIVPCGPLQGLYEWNRMPFGLTNAPATLQRNMMKILGNFPGVFIYLDDILICSNSEIEHIASLQRVFRRLAQYGIKLGLDKCEFFKTELEYL